MKTVRELVENINDAVEWHTDYMEDDQAGIDNVPSDVIASAMTMRETDIEYWLRDNIEGCKDMDRADIERVTDDIFHFCIESRTDHVFSRFDHEDHLYIDSWPIEEHQTEIDASLYGRLTKARIEVIEKEIDANIADYDHDTIILAWPTDAVWVFFARKKEIQDRVWDMIEEDA